MGRTWSISLRLFGSAAIWIFIPLTAALFLANIFLAEAIVTPLETKMEADLDEFRTSSGEGKERKRKKKKREENI